MQESLRQLVALHRVDDELAGVEAETAALPERQARAEAERTAAEEGTGQAREALRQRELELREAEAQLADTRTRKQQLEAQQFQVKSNDAYRALMSELEQADVRIEALETRELEADYAVDEAREALEAAQETAGRVGARVAETLVQLEARAGELAKERERLSAAHDEVAARIDPALLARYRKVVERRRPGVAIVAAEVCSGCRVGIPPQDFLDIVRGDAIVVCGSCRRILVHESVLAAEG